MYVVKVWISFFCGWNCVLVGEEGVSSSHAAVLHDPHQTRFQARCLLPFSVPLPAAKQVRPVWAGAWRVCSIFWPVSPEKSVFGGYEAGPLRKLMTQFLAGRRLWSARNFCATGSTSVWKGTAYLMPNGTQLAAQRTDSSQIWLKTQLGDKVIGKVIQSH